MNNAILNAKMSGSKAYDNGVDMFNSPSYLSPQEKEAWLQGYEDRMKEYTEEMLNEDSEDNYLDELDFNSDEK